MRNKILDKFTIDFINNHFEELDLEKLDWHEAKYLAIIFDNYAIEFLNYYLHNKANSRYVFSNLSAEEALEKFKQEKGL